MQKYVHLKKRKRKKENFALMEYVTGRSGEEGQDAQANRLTTPTLTQTYKVGPHCSALKGLIVHLALRSMGPSTDR